MARRPRRDHEDWDTDLSHDDDFDGEFQSYVPVSAHRERAQEMARKLAEDGQVLEPAKASAKSLSTSFWGQAWNRHLEAFSDYKTRLPRGRSYLRNGYVIDLKITPGRIQALVHGKELYELSVRVAPQDDEKWEAIRRRCQGSIDSLLDLLQGKLSDSVMRILTDPETGIFPQPHEIKASCNCLDWADLCKHSAAALYGVGVRLDTQPELLFTLRGVAKEELIQAAATAEPLGAEGTLTGVDLGDLFGLDMESET